MVSSLVQCSSVLQKYPLHEQGDLWRRIRPLEATRKGEQAYAIEGCQVSFCQRKNKMYSKVKILNTLRNNQNFTTQCHSNSIAFDQHESPAMLQQTQNISLISIWTSFLKNVKTLYEFTRPYTIIGSVVGVTSNSLLAIEALSDFSPAFFLGLTTVYYITRAWIPAILINTFSSRINQVYDVELDKVNKPFPPIDTGEYSMKTGIIVRIISGLLALGLAVMSKSPPILIMVVSAFLLGCSYSIDVPYLRRKRSSLFTALGIMYMRGVVVPFAFFAHTQKYILGRPLVYTRPVFFAASFMCTMAMTITLLKDLADVERDQVHGLNTLTVRIGRKKVFLFCNLAIMMAYGGAVIVGLTSPLMFIKIITVFGHCIMAAILMFKARTIDLSDNKSTLDFYLFIWKLLYAEYFLFPFVR